MSWEKPIEEEILQFCRAMARQFDQSAASNQETGWFANNSLSDQCAAMAKAYRTVEKHIISEMSIRSKVRTPAQKGVHEKNK